jgi:hypothetical protein
VIYSLEDEDEEDDDDDTEESSLGRGPFVFGVTVIYTMNWMWTLILLVWIPHTRMI